MNRLVEYYAKAVNHPSVSGFEHLEMLMVRDKLADMEQTLLPAERDQLKEADWRLAEHAAEFHAQLVRITDLQTERAQRQVPSSHWWWYLDVLVQAPSLRARASEPTPVPG